MLVLRLDFQQGKKTWVALITGLVRTYGLGRDFITPAFKKKATDTELGQSEYPLVEDGYYEVCERDTRKFYCLTDEALAEVTKEDVWEWLLDRKKKAKAERERKKARRQREIEEEQRRHEELMRHDAAAEQQINERLLRFNQEGGFSAN